MAQVIEGREGLEPHKKLCIRRKVRSTLTERTICKKLFALVILFWCHYTEAATGGVLLKMVFLEILQNWQENTHARISFLIKLQALGRKKRDSGTGVFL